MRNWKLVSHESGSLKSGLHKLQSLNESCAIKIGCLNAIKKALMKNINLKGTKRY